MVKVNHSFDNNGSRYLPWYKKIVYGSGDWSRASFNTLRQFFYAIFLTDVVGLDPRLASFATLIGIIWDAINDPIVGSISDNVRTKWGRRRPFLILFAVPFALAFILLWWAPPWQSQVLLMVHITLAFMVSDTLQTLVTVPYLSLTPEVSADYDDRTSLTTYRMFFNLIASLVTAVAAPSILDGVVNAGFSQQQGYLTVAAIFGFAAVFPYLLIYLLIKERPMDHSHDSEQITFKQTITRIWSNTPFRYATGIYVLNWISVDIVASMIPFFLLYWVSSGDLVAQVNIAGAGISLESVVLGCMMLSATATLPIWNKFAHVFNKRNAYLIGIGLWIIIQLIIFSIQPGQIFYIIAITVISGFFISNAHVIPESIFPDVIDWGELISNSRQEGMYYGAVNFLRKLSSAVAIFLVLQVLGWFGYQAPPENSITFTQNSQTLMAIRILTGPFVSILLIGAFLFTWFYPLSRERQRRISRSLERRQARTRQQ